LGETAPSGSHIYSVRSNMVGGYPNPDPNAPINAPRIAPRNEHQMVRA
jgi:hypothetical protein